MEAVILLFRALWAVVSTITTNPLLLILALLSLAGLLIRKRA